MVMLPPQAYPDWQGQQERYQSGPWLQEQLRKYIREGLSTPQILQKLARESFGGDTNKARQFVMHSKVKCSAEKALGVSGEPAAVDCDHPRPVRMTRRTSSLSRLHWAKCQTALV